ncbi:uncharacterized protein LOC118456350 [Anopheles albimanus]|uniref:uncharacterized protein LOC118456350 n=1 Tax=Anopheles albimanus TaxID=7167 RepID=UPI00163E00FC|nr:uncharacterized protein LOC118456350 [Anopheles albimanus]
MDIFKFLFVLLLCTASARAFWWSSPQTNEIPPASKQVQYVRAFTYQPVAFPAHSLLAPPSAFKFIPSSPALMSNSISMGKQQVAAPLQTPSPPVQPLQLRQATAVHLAASSEMRLEDSLLDLL